MKKSKLIVFDWNGTILADTIPCWKASNACLEFYGVPPIDLKRYRETCHFPVIHFYKLNGACVDRVLQHKDEANKIFYTHYTRLAAANRTRAGVRELLTWLEAQKFDRTILSNYITEEIEKQLKRLKLERYFSHVCGNGHGNTVLQHTTKTQRLSEFMLKRGYYPENTYLIGDSTEEPEIAHKLGLKCISITGGYFSTKRLRAAKPHFLVHSMQDVIEILQGEC
jgi:phosphoglycolate phosphatase-like HAD superfamily hydrolase